jgi:hypothetical protein
MTPKPRTTTIADSLEIAALKAAGKYKETVPLWRQNGDTLLVGEIDVLKTWREARVTSGKNLCQK